VKVAFDNQVFSFQKHGGVSRYFAELFGNFSQRRDMEVAVVAPFYVNDYLRRSAARQHIHGRYVPWEFRGSERVLRILNSAALPAFWGATRFDVIHETYYSAKIRGHCRFRVMTIHDMIYELFPQNFVDAKRLAAAKYAAARRADYIICVSETTRRDVIRMLGVDSSRCGVIYHGCSLDFRSAETNLDGAMLPCVLYVGQRNGYKNFRVLLEAFSGSSLLKKRFHLVAFGGGPFSGEESRDIERRALRGQVHQVSGDDGLLCAFYRAASVFVYPSRYEGFGIPPLEAMANGCPVACSDAASIVEVVGDAGVYFDPDDDEQLGLLLEKMIEDCDYSAELRAKGLARAGQYSWARCAEETLHAYRSLLR
jgi:glycosyltransferase involved in cell wall biosynthesis